MHAGHGKRYIPVSVIAKNLGPTVCESLPACHALTGCDSNSSLYRIGKKTAFTKLEKNSSALTDLKYLGVSANLEEALPVARKYALPLYSPKKKDSERCSTLDALRYHLASTTDMPASSLPPTEDAFKQHVWRAMYQTAIWCHSYIPKPLLWDPEGKGWIKENGHLEPVLFTKDAAPVEVRDITHLYCADGVCKDTRKCQCLAKGLHCTEFCACADEECSNTSYPIEVEENDI